ncbi:MAG TPA: hypothetical protein VGH49_14360 [Xanthobacteraceae bacterium]|jgi:hypothetical protein
MLTALVLICSLGVTPDLRDCTRDNAADVIRVPVESANPANCLMQGQAVLASTMIGRDLGADDRVKIVCARSQTVDASVHRVIVK